ncbi:hypothetical protein, partial [Bacteroides heparinolyticus]|uniref:hypothetical protein n=1 Tax=Prevotella heparinolytica TaxID=28113 RepID=UPI0035A0EB51
IVPIIKKFFVLIKSLCCRGGDARETSAAISLPPPSGVYRCLCFRYAGKDMAHIFLPQMKKGKSVQQNVFLDSMHSK